MTWILPILVGKSDIAILSFGEFLLDKYWEDSVPIFLIKVYQILFFWLFLGFSPMNVQFKILLASTVIVDKDKWFYEKCGKGKYFF